MKIAEAASETGLSIATIRFYERSGLCPAIPRGQDGQRYFTRDILQWLTLLASLRDTGMSMRNMQAFAELYQHGDATVPARKAALLAHSETLRTRRAALDRCEILLATKIDRYDMIIGDKT